jgi:two-component system response regulator YesN
MPDRIRILIVDDCPRARQSLRALLAIYAEDTEVQEAENGLEALQCIDQSPPGLVFMDIRMPGLDGMRTTQLIKQHVPHVKVIALSIARDFEYEALAAGADAFVCKSDPPGVLLETLARVGGLLEDDNGRQQSVL